MDAEEAASETNVVNEAVTELWDCCDSSKFDMALFDRALEKINASAGDDASKRTELVNQQRSGDRRSALHMCCSHCHAEAACRLVQEYGADVNARAQAGLKPLHLAARKGNAEICQMLLDSGADVDAADKKQMRPIHFASQNGRLAVCQLLLRYSADINLTAKDGATPLHHACYGDFTTICDLLVYHEANVNATTADGRSALHAASDYGHEAICKQLLEFGADIDSPDNMGMGPLQCASASGHANICKLLIEHGADVHASHEDALCLASFHGHAEVCKVLLQKGAKPNPIGLDVEEQPLAQACEQGHKAVCELLIAHGANIHAGDEEILRLACRAGSFAICALLIRHGAQVNKADEDGMRPLHIACSSGNANVCQVLLNNNADSSAANKSRQRPFALAVETGHAATLQVMLSNRKVNISKPKSMKSDLVREVVLHMNRQAAAKLKREIDAIKKEPFSVLGHILQMREHITSRINLVQSKVDELVELRCIAEGAKKLAAFKDLRNDISAMLCQQSQEVYSSMDLLPDEVKTYIERRDNMRVELTSIRLSTGPTASENQIGSIADLLDPTALFDLENATKLADTVASKIDAVHKECLNVMQTERPSNIPGEQLARVREITPDNLEQIDATFDRLTERVETQLARLHVSRMEMAGCLSKLRSYLTASETAALLSEVTTLRNQVKKTKKLLRRALEDADDETIDEHERQEWKIRAQQFTEDVSKAKANLKALLERLGSEAGNFNPELLALVPELWVGQPSILRRSLEDYDRQDAKVIMGGRHKLLVCKYDGKPCALKAFVVDDNAKRRMRNQLNMWARLQESRAPHVLSVEAVVVDAHNPHEVYIHVPYMQNGDLATYMEAHAADFTPARCQDVLYRILEALNHLHLLGVVHMDIKLQNILINDDIHPILSDFDISKDLGSRQQTLTQTALGGGTLEYMAPEIRSFKGDITTKCDMYSFGVLMEKVVSRHRQPAALDLISRLKSRLPKDRPTAGEALRHNYFRVTLQGFGSDMIGPPEAPWRYRESALKFFKQHSEGYYFLKIKPQDSLFPEVHKLIKDGSPDAPTPNVAQAMLVHDPHKQVAFYGKMRSLGARYASKLFKRFIPAEHDHAVARKVTDYVCNNEKRYPSLCCSSLLPGPAPLFLRRAYHGVSSHKTALEILKGDFAALASTDGGWFGAGVYFTLDLDYALQYAHHDIAVGGKVVIMCDIVFGNPYPLIETQLGRGMKPGCDAHLAVVKLPGSNESIVDASPVTDEAWDTTAKATEIVLVDTSHIFIRAVLVIKP